MWESKTKFEGRTYTWHDRKSVMRDYRITSTESYVLWLQRIEPETIPNWRGSNLPDLFLKTAPRPATKSWSCHHLRENFKNLPLGLPNWSWDHTYRDWRIGWDTLIRKQHIYSRIRGCMGGRRQIECQLGALFAIDIDSPVIATTGPT